ncbi:MAG TPA: NfeD family protein [Solirubrobacterales bacterium]|jgi:membrane-bound serine protease (ClpP class)
MEFFVVVALIGVALLLAEMMLPTGGILATLGVLGLIAGGVLALSSDSSEADWLGPALITLGILSGISFYFVTRKVLAAHRDEPVRAGSEELVGADAEVRSSLDPEGQVWIEGALWRARLVGEGGPLRPGDRVTIEAVDGLTLTVRAEPSQAEKGAG